MDGPGGQVPVMSSSCPDPVLRTSPTGLGQPSVTQTTLRMRRRSRTPREFFLLTLLYLFILPCVIKAVNHVNFKVLSLNTKGMSNPVKINKIRNVLAKEKPNAFVINETKSVRRTSQSLNLGSEYEMYEELGRPINHGRSGKWGVIVGVRHGIQVAKRIVNSTPLRGRAVQLDLRPRHHIPVPTVWLLRTLGPRSSRIDKLLELGTDRVQQGLACADGNW